MVLGINKNYNYISNNNIIFGARLSKDDIDKLIKSAQSENPQNSIFPEIYTLLERLDEIEGKRAYLIDKYQEGGIWNGESHLPGIKIENEKFAEGGYYDGIYKILKNTILSGTKTIYKMSNEIYDQICWSHRNVKQEDLYKFAIDA